MASTSLTTLSPATDIYASSLMVRLQGFVLTEMILHESVWKGGDSLPASSQCDVDPVCPHIAIVNPV